MHHHNREKFEEICELIKSVESDGDAILQTLKLRTINEKFRDVIKDEKMLSEIFDMFNSRALEEEEFILSLVTVITSRQLDSFTVNGKILRHSMLTICQKNFQNVDNFKRDDMNKFYNSLKLLGEYFNKARLSNGVPINIIGQSLLNLINVELEKELRNICHLKTDRFAKLVLSQIALNGSLLKTRHKTEIETVLFTIRKCLIELDSLTPKTKAFLIMSLDLYYSNFTNVGDALEKMYQTFLVEDIKVSKANHVENGKTPPKPPIENGKVQAPQERIAPAKKPEDNRKPVNVQPQRNLKVQIRKPEPIRNRGGSLTRNAPASPRNLFESSRNSPRIGPTSPRNPSASPRNTPASPVPSTTNGPVSPHHKNLPRSVQKVSPPQKKISPQELRSKGSTRSESVPRRYKPHYTELVTPQIERSPTQTNGTDENVLRQQNSRSSTPSSSAPGPVKYKVNNKVYFREENVENLTWNGETSFDGDAEDPDESTSPKVNPYSSSFLNFLSSN